MSNQKNYNLYQVLLSIKDENEMEKFFLDLCTPSEIRALKERWNIAQTIENTKQSYREISKNLKVSVTTIGRVARFLNESPYGGYRAIMDRLKK